VKSVLITRRLNDDIQTLSDVDQREFRDLLKGITTMNREQLIRKSTRISNEEPELYSLPHGSARYIFSLREQGIILLSRIVSEGRRAGRGAFLENFRRLSPQEQLEMLESVLSDAGDDIVDTEEFVSAMATTNASDWRITRIVVTNYDLTTVGISARVSWNASGEQDEDRAYYGTRLRGTATATVDRDGVVTFTDVSAKSDDSNDHPE
jgi:hypothetical protein